MPASASPPRRDHRDEARGLLRRWLASDERDAISTIDSLGRSAIRRAAEASGRLGRGVSSARSAEQTLGNLQALAASFEAPAGPRTKSLFARNGRRDDDMDTRIEALLQNLDSERDDVARSLITIETDARKLREAADALDEALSLIRACAAAVEAAIRELATDRPERARFLREAIAGRLLEREQDVAAQAAVTHQGILTLQLLSDGQNALVQALARARETSISALRTAIAARRAIAGSEDVARQTEALARTARAAEDGSSTRGDLRRVLDDAIDQARRAIDAAQANARGGATPP